MIDTTIDPELRRLIVGVDPSLTATGLAYISDHGDVSSCTIKSKPAKGACGRLARYRGLVERISAWVSSVIPKAVFIEGYSYGSKGSSVYQLAEFGGILRERLERNWPIYEIPPGTLKKFVTGSGNAKKEDMMKAMRQLNPNNHNEADALGLAALGVKVFYPTGSDAMPEGKQLEAYQAACKLVAQEDGFRVTRS